MKLSERLSKRGGDYADWVGYFSKKEIVEAVTQLEADLEEYKEGIEVERVWKQEAYDRNAYLKEENAALKRFCTMVRESIEGGRVVTFQDIDIEELDALLKKEQSNVR